MHKQLSVLKRKLSSSGSKKVKIFRELDEVTQAQLLLILSKNLQQKIMTDMNDKELINILDHLDPDEITMLLRQVSDKRKTRIINRFQAHIKQSVELLDQFDASTAGGLMSLDYIQVNVEDSIADIANQFKIHEELTGKPPVIFVIENGILKGSLPGYILGLKDPKERIRNYIETTITINHASPQDEVINLFRSHPNNKVAVIGEKGNIIGVIYSNDVLKILNENETNTLYDFAGVDDEEDVMDSALQKVNHRYKWLIINLGTAFLAAFTVGLFDEIIAKNVLLAVYMPIVAGMGGNAGTQTLAVLVRGITLKQIDLATALPTLKREVLAGLINGVINGILVALIIMIVSQDIKVAIILGIAMVVNLIVAATFGTLIPVIMKKLGKDPATSATIFITTATDVLGFLAFLSLATVIL